MQKGKDMEKANFSVTSETIVGSEEATVTHLKLDGDIDELLPLVMSTFDDVLEQIISGVEPDKRPEVAESLVRAVDLGLVPNLIGYTMQAQELKQMRDMVKKDVMRVVK